jgi:hypothetical protein
MGDFVPKLFVSPKRLPFQHTEHQPEGFTMKEAPLSQVVLDCFSMKYGQLPVKVKKVGYQIGGVNVNFHEQKGADSRACIKVIGLIRECRKKCLSRPN